MSTWLKVLVATACFFVIGATSWWMIDRHQQKTSQASLSEALNRNKRDRTLEECTILVSAHEAGDNGPAHRKYGTSIEAGISLCRTIIQLDEVRSSN